MQITNNVIRTNLRSRRWIDSLKKLASSEQSLLNHAATRGIVPEDLKTRQRPLTSELSTKLRAVEVKRLQAEA
jgi:hypothetical protein